MSDSIFELINKEALKEVAIGSLIENVIANNTVELTLELNIYKGVEVKGSKEPMRY